MAVIGPEALLLTDPSPVLRARVLAELLHVEADDDELASLREPVAAAADRLLPERGDDLRGLCWALCRLAYAGLGREDGRVRALAEAVFSRQLPDGSFPLAAFRSEGGKYDLIPLQTALPLRGLAAAGWAQDPRAERAYRWLLDQRLPDGAWPVGLAAGQPGYIAGYRHLPGSRGCRANTTGALACLALHPELARSDAVRLPLDLLLQRETRDEWTIGYEVARLVGTERATGFITSYARFDLAFLLSLCSLAGASPGDPRVAGLLRFLEDLRGPQGLWAHPAHAELSRWLTFDILRSLDRLAGGDWVGVAPRVPFRAYPRRRRRY